MTEKITTQIADDVEITGTIKCSSNIIIEGKLKGDLICENDVIIGESAVIEGNINVNSAVISGQVTGNIEALDKIELKSTANIVGDVRAKRMTVEDGVSFVGKVEVNPAGEYKVTHDNNINSRGSLNF